VWLLVERACWAFGGLALVVWVAATFSGTVEMRRSLARFASTSAVQAAWLAPTPDQRLWSPERMRAWQDTLTSAAPAPMAVLRIRRLGLEVPVLAGTDAWTLNRAVGHIEDTAHPGADGNCGIAGHRDGFFRGLKDIRRDDVIEIETPGRVDRYRVARMWIVQPEDVSVLDPTTEAVVTLVTCYPFYFVGSAPQRFIVRAIRTES
jgi:sortase A